MKNLKRILLLLLVVLIIAIVYNYPRLNILAGYSAKNIASSVFIADRTLAFTDSTDNNFSPINLTSGNIDENEKSATSSAFGLLKRKAIYRDGLGSVLTIDETDENAPFLIPKRLKPDNITPYPYGNGPQKDTVFKEVNYDKLASSVANVFKDEAQTRAVVVVYKDKIIAEKYGNEFNENSKILGWSMTKSITGTLFGILEHQQKINVFDKAPIEEWKNDERQNITIHNLLQMNSGLAWEENYTTISDVTKMLFLSKDMTFTQVNKELAAAPNTNWNYSSGTTNVLSRILRQQFKTHQEYLDFWYTALIDKIGMNSMLIEADLNGNYVGSSYGWATPRDWAKLGLLYLHNGNWNGTELFTKNWVDYATTKTPTSNGTYGAQIWLNAENKFPNVPKTMYSFNGYQGQFVFVLPEQDLVVVRMGLTKNFDIDAFLCDIIASLN